MTGPLARETTDVELEDDDVVVVIEEELVVDEEDDEVSESTEAT